MKGDFTRFTFRPEKHYRDVHMQQGRVQLDADWNESADIQTYLREQITEDVVGPTGAPKRQDSFRIDLVEADGADLLTIAPGHFYVSGLLCELSATVLPVLSFPDGQSVQLPTLTVEGQKFEAGGWVRVYAETTTEILQIDTVGTDSLTLSTTSDLSVVFGAAAVSLQRLTTTQQQPFVPEVDDEVLALDVQTNYVVYLKAWKRHITAVEDPALREEALGGADTTTRTQLVWQVALETTDAATCAALGPDWRPEGNLSSGALRARSQPDEVTDNLCLIPEEGGYRRLENQLYRVEVHTAGDPDSDTPTFKWSRDNGFRVTRLLEIDGQVLRVADTGRDAFSGLAAGQQVEVRDERQVLAGEPGILAAIVTVDGNEVTLDTDVSGMFAPESFLTTLRRWEGTADLTTGSYLELEDGVQVAFDDGYYNTGDYWVIPARTISGNIHWPVDADTQEPLFQPKRGIYDACTPLALLVSDGTQHEVVDCRALFPALTEIAAEDVSYDNAACQLNGATNVQEALDQLCLSQHGSCTLTLLPGEGWEAALSQLQVGQDAQLCFQSGTYPIRNPVVLRNLGHLKLTGTGTGTRLVAANAEAALVFENCRSVVVRDLYAETGQVASGSSTTRTLNGTLTFRGCAAVEVASAALRCGNGPERGASCLTVDQAVPTHDGQHEAGTVRIRHCDLRVGHQQVGILLLNVTRSHVADNVIRVHRLSSQWSPERLLQNKAYRGGVRRLLISNGDIDVDDEDLVGGAPRGMALVQFGGHTILFETPPALEDTWERLLEVTQPLGVQSPRDLYLHLRNMADRLLANGGELVVRDSVFTGFRSWYNQLRSANVAVASQGIVVGGTLARDVRILNNTVLGVLQGIHLGLDNATPSRSEALGTVRVKGNTVGVIVSPYLRERHGLFVGHCDSLLAEDNDIRIRRLTVTDHVRIEGVRVYGVLGRKMVVRQNYIANATIGVRISPLNNVRTQGRPQWFVTDNVITGVPEDGRAVQAPSTVLGQEANYS